MDPSWNEKASEVLIRRVAAEQSKSLQEIEAIAARARAKVEQVRVLLRKGR